MPPSIDQYKARAEAFAARCGARVRVARLGAGLTQAQLAAATFAPNPASISHWESGRFMPSVMRQFAIADALTMPMSTLWGHRAPAEERSLVTHYLSLECQHDHHGDDCRRACPECSAPCRCWCHLDQPALAAERLGA